MRVFVTVRARAKKELVEAVDPTHFHISVKAAPLEGKANEAVMRALARYLGIASSRLSLRFGASGKKKVFDIAEH